MLLQKIYSKQTNCMYWIKLLIMKPMTNLRATFVWFLCRQRNISFDLEEVRVKYTNISVSFEGNVCYHQYWIVTVLFVFANFFPNPRAIAFFCKYFKNCFSMTNRWTNNTALHTFFPSIYSTLGISDVMAKTSVVVIAIIYKNAKRSSEYFQMSCQFVLTSK